MATHYKLIPVHNVKKEWEIKHKIYALEIYGRCYVNDFIKSLQIPEKSEYKKIMKVIKLLANYERIYNRNHVKRINRYPGIYEIISKTGHARISYFYYGLPQEDVICVLGFWKSEDSQVKKQNDIFRKSKEIMESYIKE